MNKLEMTMAEAIRLVEEDIEPYSCFAIEDAEASISSVHSQVPLRETYVRWTALRYNAPTEIDHCNELNFAPGYYPSWWANVVSPLAKGKRLQNMRLFAQHISKENP